MLFLSRVTGCNLYNLFPSYSDASVSIQETEISVQEDIGGQICIILATGLERDISVTLTTTAETASKCIVTIPREYYQNFLQ